MMAVTVPKQIDADEAKHVAHDIRVRARLPVSPTSASSNLAQSQPEDHARMHREADVYDSCRGMLPPSLSDPE